MFPLGSTLKSEVKRIAKEIGLQAIAEKRESMGICFIGKRKFNEFMSEYVSPLEGEFVNIDTGEVVGKHRGIHNYTIGQRLLVPGQKERLYALRKMSDQKTILVGARLNHPAMLFDLFFTESPHWVDQSPFNGNTVARIAFRFQHGHKLETCDIIQTPEGLLVKLKNPVRAICAGQFAVFYREDECLGSAKISSTGPSVDTNL